MGRRDPVSRNEKVNQLITEKPNSLLVHIKNQA